MTATQLTLFGDFSPDPMPAVKAAMNQAVKGCGLSRDQVVDRMNVLAAASGIPLNKNAKRLSAELFEKWLNPADLVHKPSLQAVSVFMAAVRDPAPLDAVARLLGWRVVDERQAKLLERAEVEEHIRELQRRKKQIEASL